METTSSVQRALREHQKLIDEGIRRINDYRLTKFDKLQFSSLLKEEIKEKNKIEEVTKDLQQKIFGPDFQLMAIKIQYGIIKELARVALPQYALYVQASQPAFINMYFALSQKVNELICNALDNDDSYNDSF